MACVVLLNGVASAAEPEVSCLPQAEKMSAADLGAFDSDPGKLLASNPGGGLPLSESVRGLTSTSSSALEKVMVLVGKSNENQRAAIAAGLARTVAACGAIGSKDASDYADRIQAAVAASVDPILLAAFQSAGNDIRVAAVNAASSAWGGGATAGASATDRVSNGYRSGGDSPYDTSAYEYSIDYVNSYGVHSRATSNSGTGQ